MMYEDNHNSGSNIGSSIPELYTEDELNVLESIEDKEELKQAVSNMDLRILDDCKVETCMGEGEVVTGIRGNRIEGHADVQVHRFGTLEDLNVNLGDVTFTMDNDGKNVDIQSLNIDPSDMDLFEISVEDIIDDIYDNLNTNFDIGMEVQSFKDREKTLDSVLDNADAIQKSASHDQLDKIREIAEFADWQVEFFNDGDGNKATFAMPGFSFTVPYDSALDLVNQVNLIYEDFDVDERVMDMIHKDTSSVPQVTTFVDDVRYVDDMLRNLCDELEIKMPELREPLENGIDEEER